MVPQLPTEGALGGALEEGGEGMETVEGLLAACKSPPLTIVRIDISVASILTGFSPV